MTKSYINDHKEYWGPEFASILKIPYRREHDEVAAMGATTAIYHVADNFRDGKFRKEILKQFGLEK